MNLLVFKIPTKSVFDDTVNQILEQPSYKHLSNDWLDISDRLKEYIYDWLVRLISKFNMGSHFTSIVSKNISVVFKVIFLLIILAIIISIVIRMNKSFNKKRKVKEILGEKIEESTTPSSLRYKAKEYEKQGELRAAIRFDFIALLLLMHDNSILYLDETKTNEEILQFLKNNHFKMINLISLLVKNFNYFWYGHKVCEKDIYEKWKTNLEQVWNEVQKNEKKKK